MDIGSNTIRLVVFDRGAGNDLRLTAEAKATLRLERGLGKDGTLSKAAAASVKTALAEFAAVAGASGARQVVAVATAAFRDAVNKKEVAAQLKAETGITLRILTGEEEAAFAFVGAIYGLPVENGVLFDIGGGSLEIIEFAKRSLVKSWSLPFGALRISDQLLTSDPPSQKEVEKLEQLVQNALVDSGVPALPAGARLVGSGGSIRNISKMDRRSRVYAIRRLHGYEVSVKRLNNLKDQICTLSERERRSLKGLNPERSDSIAGGAIVISALAAHVGAKDILVSGRGLREGVALCGDSGMLPPIADVRLESVESLASRFATWRPFAAGRRAEIARAVCEELGLGEWEGLPELTGLAARLLDAGSSIDYYNRVDHAATIIEEGDLGGFTHRDVALMSAVTRQAQRSLINIDDYRPLLSAKDHLPVLQAGTVLAIADEIERRLPATRRPDIRVKNGRDRTVLSHEGLGVWDPGWLTDRFEFTFGRQLAVTGA